MVTNVGDGHEDHHPLVKPSAKRASLIDKLLARPNYADELANFCSAEIRGEFDPISTIVPGMVICELLPNPAKQMDDRIHKRCRKRGVS